MFKRLGISTTTTALAFYFVSVTSSYFVVGCSDTQKQTAQETIQNIPESSAQLATEQSPAAQQIPNEQNTLNSFKIYDATIVVSPQKAFPEKILGKFIPNELLRTLYTSELKPDETSTLTVRDMLVEPLDTEQGTFVAIVKTATKNDNCILDVFTFREGNEQPVVAHVAYNPDFDDIDLKAAYNKKFRISDTEYAIAFEWNASQADAQNTQRTTMLSLFRLQNDIMKPIFELCVDNKISNNAVNADEFEAITEDKATLETVNTWGKELYSILVTRTASRKSALETNSVGETKHTKILYQWDGERYVETNQLL